MTPAAPQTIAGALVLLGAIGLAVGALAARVLQQAARRKSRSRATVEGAAHELEQRAVLAEAAFQDLFNTSSSGLCLIDANGAIVAANPALEQLLDLTPSDALESLAASETARSALATLNEEGILSPRDVVLDGLSSRQLRISGRRLTSATGTFLHDRLAFEDVTRIRVSDRRIHDLEIENASVKGEAERQARDLVEESLELARSRDRAQRLARTRVDLLASFATEIRQRIAPISNFSQLLRNHGSGPPELLDLVRNAARDVTSAVDEITEYSRIETGQVELADVAFSVRSLVESVADGVAEKAEANGVEIICNVAGDMPVAAGGDAGRLRQILHSLMSNAVEHTHSGEVSLRAEVTGEAGELSIVRFEVEDSGDGIRPEVLATLFEPSAHAIAARGRSARNGRIGLAISRQLVELMGGQMGVESAPGQGTRFWLAVKLKKRSSTDGKGDKLGASPASRSDSEKLRSLENRRILVADDVASVRGVVVEMVQRLGMRSATARDGNEAVKMLLEAAAGDDPFAVAILDYEMPGGNGLETAQAIRDLPVGRQTSLVLTIPASLRHWRDEPVLEGVQAVISKPVQENALCAALARCADEIATREPAQSLAELNSALQGSEASTIPVQEDIRRGLVLIAEDNLVNQRVARSLVEKMGYATEVVSDGRQAVEAVANGHFDLVLMDCQMPEMDGLTATAEIRGMDGEKQYTPIIAMTANAMRGDRERCLEAGMNDYVSKPVVYETLHSVLSYWLSRSEAAVAGD